MKDMASHKKIKEDIDIKVARTVSVKNDYDLTIQNLQKIYGIDNLSLIEKVHLKNLVKKCRKEYFRSLLEYKLGKITHYGIGDRIYLEAISRWFYDLYGLKTDDLDGEKLLLPETKEYIRRIRERAHFP